MDLMDLLSPNCKFAPGAGAGSQQTSVDSAAQ
jgi:hypothetical protein